MRNTTVYNGVYHTPLERFFKLDWSTTKRLPTPNNPSSEKALNETFVSVKLSATSSNAGLFGTNATYTIPTVEIPSMENQPRGGGDIHPPPYTIGAASGEQIEVR